MSDPVDPDPAGPGFVLLILLAIGVWALVEGHMDFAKYMTGLMVVLSVGTYGIALWARVRLDEIHSDDDTE